MLQNFIKGSSSQNVFISIQKPQNNHAETNLRLVDFQDQSVGKITSWKWDFGDGKTSNEQHPLHTYEKAGLYIVALYIEGPDGKSRRSKVWDLAIR